MQPIERNATKSFKHYEPLRVAEAVIQRLKDQGFAIRLTGTNEYQTSYSAFHKEKGVRFSIQVASSAENKWVQFAGKVRSSKGTFCQCSSYLGNHGVWHGNTATVATTNYSKDEIDTHHATLVEEIMGRLTAIKGEAVTNPVPKNKSDLYPPLKFDKPGYVEVELKTVSGSPAGATRIDQQCGYRDCYVKGIVAINSNLKINSDNISKPDTKCWFHIVGESTHKRSGAAIEIIVAEQKGELVYYPIRNNKITNDFQPMNTYINFEAFTELDKVLIEKAIAVYMRDLG